MELEREIIGQLLFAPEKEKVIEILPEWFTTAEYRAIVEEIKATEGENLDFILMAENIRKKHNYTSVTKNFLLDLASESVTSANLEKHAHALKVRYYEVRLRDYSETFSSNPNKKTFANMKNAMADLEDVRQGEEDFGLRGATDELYFEMEHGTKSGVHVYDKMSNVLGDGLSGGMLITIGARPGVGKTTLGVNLIVEALEREDEDLTVDLFTLEMTKKDMLKKIISRITGMDSYKFVNTRLQLTEHEKTKVIVEAEKLNKTNLAIIDSAYSIDDIIRTIRRRKYTAKGKYIAFIDYLQLIKGNNDLQRYLQIGEITRQLKILTNVLDIPIVIFAQVSRGVEQRQDKTPTLADLRESGDIEQDSNVVMFISENEDDKGIADISIAKNRNGRTTKIQYRYLKAISLMTEL